MRRMLDKFTWQYFALLIMTVVSGVIGLIFGSDYKPVWWFYVVWLIICVGFCSMMEWIYRNKIEKLHVKIKLFGNDYSLMPEKKGDLIDLRAAEDVEIKKGEFKLIPLGVAMKLPAGYKANLMPRSSTYKNYKILVVNSPGQIDNAYCGNNDQWMLASLAMEDTLIHKGDRICQFEIVPVMNPVRFDIVDELEDKDRGGIGSTGVK